MCRLSPGEFNRITPAELADMAEAIAKYRNADHRFFDSLNAISCSTLATINGAKGAKPADFMITKRETEKEEDVDPMQKVSRIHESFQSWAMMTGGK